MAGPGGRKFYVDEDGQTVITNKLTKQEVSNIWNSLSEESKTKLYYNHLNKHKGAASTGEIDFALENGTFQSQRSINHARMDTASGTTFVETTSPSTEAEVLAGKTPNPPKATPTDTTEEDKRILDEHLATAKQCYLLNFLADTRQRIAAPDVTTWGQRLFS